MWMVSVFGNPLSHVVGAHNEVRAPPDKVKGHGIKRGENNSHAERSIWECWLCTLRAFFGLAEVLGTGATLSGRQFVRLLFLDSFIF